MSPTGKDNCRSIAEQVISPCLATRYIEMIPENIDLTAVVNQAREELNQHVRNPSVHSAAFAIDPNRWEMVHFTLWNNTADEVAGERYKVLHLSTPHLEDIRSTIHI